LAEGEDFFAAGLLEAGLGLDLADRGEDAPRLPAFGVGRLAAEGLLLGRLAEGEDFFAAGLLEAGLGLDLADRGTAAPRLLEFGVERLAAEGLPPAR
jgi:hypothetical protein